MLEEQVFTNCTNGGAVFVHVRDGKIVRVRPIVFGETDAASWTIDVNGRKFSPPRKACLSSYTLAERARVYSDARIKYPLKRIDFDPNGDRHPETRGKSKYERISWDKALDIVASEMKRIRTTYGPEVIMSRCSSHHNWGNGPAWITIHVSVKQPAHRCEGQLLLQDKTLVFHGRDIKEGRDFQLEIPLDTIANVDMGFNEEVETRIAFDFGTGGFEPFAVRYQDNGENHTIYFNTCPDNYQPHMNFNNRKWCRMLEEMIEYQNL